MLHVITCKLMDARVLFVCLGSLASGECMRCYMVPDFLFADSTSDNGCRSKGELLLTL
jgi:hypothetical protein